MGVNSILGEFGGDGTMKIYQVLNEHGYPAGNEPYELSFFKTIPEAKAYMSELERKYGQKGVTIREWRLQMTRKDFRELAQAVREITNLTERALLCERIGAICEHANSRFDWRKWREACDTLGTLGL